MKKILLALILLTNITKAQTYFGGVHIWSLSKDTLAQGENMVLGVKFANTYNSENDIILTKIQHYTDEYVWGLVVVDSITVGDLINSPKTYYAPTDDSLSTISFTVPINFILGKTQIILSQSEKPFFYVKESIITSIKELQADNYNLPVINYNLLGQLINLESYSGIYIEKRANKITKKYKN